MEHPCFISIDIGTSSCKSVLMDETGALLGSASREYPTFYGESGAVSQNADDWWDGVVATVRELAARAPDCRGRIAAIGIDGQSSVMLPLDREGNVLYPAMIWMDHRAQAQKRRIDENVGQETLSELNGNRNDASNVAPKIMWFRDHCPELYQRTDRIVSSVGFIVYRLTGVFSHNLSEGGLTQLLDIRTGAWSDPLIGGCGLDSALLPELYRCCDIVGTVRADAAGLLGIPSGIPVTAGAMDVCACALGTGAVSKGDAFITGGTVTALGVCTDRPVRNGSLHVYHHAVPGLWCSVAGVDFGGGSFRWFRDRFMAECPGADAYAEMDRLAAQSPPGAGNLLFLPALVGQRCPQWDSNMRGAFVGITPAHGKPAFLRAIMEGNAFGVREIMELQEAEGAGLNKILIAGGIAKSDLWLQIFADVLRRRALRVRSRQDTAYGNMICAAVAVGLFSSFEVTLPGRNFEPIRASAETRAVYDRLYGIYRQLYPALREQFAQLSEA